MNSGNVAITRTDLDWVCITQRAADNDTDNADLWLESVRAMRNLIAAFNSAAIDEAHAAHAQYLINRLGFIACDYGTQAVAAAGERIKDVLEAIGRGERLDALRLL